MTRRLHTPGYQLAEQIGIGGFGAVYRAYQPELDREVAIKVILSEFADQPDFIRRFEVEAQMIARLEHLHIVPLYDYWREQGGAYLVMRYLRGGNLRGALVDRGTFSAGGATRLVLQIGAALSAAHNRQIIHRDIKPENILLDEYGNAYLADFNIARDLGTPPQGSDARFGTAAYAAPEQLDADDASPQTDIYSMGVILYELLTGAPPHNIWSPEPFPPIQMTRPDLPVAVNPIIWRATTTDPAERYVDMLEFVDEVRRVLGGGGEPETIVPRRFAMPNSAERATRLLTVEPEPTNPYKGLQPFDQADADRFFGRESFVETVIKRLGERHFTAIIGASGGGKSSVARAGVLPLLRHGAIPGSNDWFYAVMTPGTGEADPFAALAAALAGVNTAPVSREQLERGAWCAGLPAGSSLVLLIDQFEEVFTAARHAIGSFLDAIATAAQDEHIYILITLRADYYDRPLAFPAFAPLLTANSEALLPLTLAEMTRAVERPAERENLRFDPGLVAQIIDDVHDEPGALPLLQFALTRLFDQREGRTLTKQAYSAHGGISGAVKGRADDLYAELDGLGRTAARQIFLRLVDPFTLTRQRVLLSDLAHIGGRGDVLERYSRARLLTLDHTPGTRLPTVEIAHEALITAWDRLRGWIDAARVDLQTHAELKRAALDWDKAQRDPSYLAAGSRLAGFEPLHASMVISLSAVERAFLDASLAAQAHGRRRRRWAQISLALIAVVGFALALIAFDGQQRAQAEARVSRSRELAAASLTRQDQVDLALLLSLEALRTEDTYEARSALLTTLGANPRLAAINVLPTGDVLSMELGQDGSPIYATRSGTLLTGDLSLNFGTPLYVVSADGTRIAAAGVDGTIHVINSRGADVFPPLQVDPAAARPAAIRALAWSPDGLTLASGGDDHLVRLWNAQTGALIAEVSGHEDAVWSLVYAPDGARLYSASADRTIRVWDAATGESFGMLEGNTNWVLTLALSPDGTRLASGGADNLIRLWDTEAGAALAIIDEHTDWIRSLAFSADGSRLASGSADDTVGVWDIDTGDGERLRGHQGDVWSVAFLPDGRLISAGADPFSLEWEVSARSRLQNGTQPAADQPIQAFALAGDQAVVIGSGMQIGVSTPNQPTQMLGEQGGLITDIRTSPDGGRIATASENGVIALWNTTTFARIRELRPNVDVIQQIAISPDGAWIAAAGGGGVSVRDVETGEEIARYAPAALSVTFAPAGNLILIGERAGGISLWRIGESDQERRWDAHSDGVMSLTFSPDGSRVVSTGRDYAVLVWAYPSGDLLYRLEGHEDWVASAVFSVDGRTLASVDHQGVIRLWDMERGLLLGTPIQAGDGWINRLAMRGDQLVSAGEDGAIRYWRLDLAAWQQIGCELAGRDLSAGEWQRYIGAGSPGATCAGE